jgi:26S proteasome regulatory subunit N1
VLCAADGRQPQGAALDSARQNLASTFVNAFVNAGYGQDKLVTVSTEGQSDSGSCLLNRLYQAQWSESESDSGSSILS